MDGPGKPDQVRSVRRIVRILSELSNSGGATVTEISESTGLPMSTIHRYLDTLHDLHYIVRDGNQYCLSIRFLNIGESARNRRRIYRLAENKLTELATETNERCQFVVEEHGRGVYALVATGGKAVLTDSRVGKRLYLHATSVGKSILAHLPDPRVEEIIDQWGLPRVTRNTITDRDELFDELKTVRENGIAFNRGGNVDGLRSVGAPVLGGDDEVVGAISISGPSKRLQGSWYEEEIPGLLLGATNELQLKLEYERD